jgi:Flp pilus assembly protein TadD
VQEGKCDRARDEARSALSALAERASPYHVIAFCDFQQERPRQAVRAMVEAVERDPSNWKLNYGLAVSRAAAGLDPRRPMRLALRLNPGEKLLREAAEEFRAATRGRWRHAGAKLALPAPGPPIP